MIKSSERNLTDGSLFRNLLFLSLPLLGQNAARVAQKVIDLFWLGRLGQDAVAAVGLVGPLTSLLTVLVVLGPFVGTQILVSERFGKGDERGARRMVFTGLTLVSVFGVAVGALMYVSSEPFVRLIVGLQGADVSSDMVMMASTYFAVYALGIPVFAASDIFEAGFVGWGDSKASMYINVLSVVGNIVLDPILIFGYGPIPALGIFGAALATVLGAFMGLLLGIALTVSGRRCTPLSWQAVSFDIGEYRELLEVGLPRTGQAVTRQVARLTMVGLVFAVGGVAGLVAYTAGNRIVSLVMIPARGIRQATQTIVAQNLGAKKSDRAIRMVWISVGTVFVLFTLLGAFQWFKPDLLLLTLIPETEGRAFDISISYLRLLVYSYPALGAFYMYQAGFDGAKQTQVSFVASLVQMWGLQLPLAAGVGLLLDSSIITVFWMIVVSYVVAALALGVYFYHNVESGKLYGLNPS